MKLRGVVLILIASAFGTERGDACDASSLITQHEGKRPCVYTDTTGHKTVGVGYNLDQFGAKSDIESIGADFDSIYSGKSCLTDSQISSLLRLSLSRAESSASTDVSSYNSLCCGVQVVMTDLAFNLGRSGFGSFGTFISLINEKKWAEAASDLRGTLWCSQVGNRCSDDASRIASGCGNEDAGAEAAAPQPSGDDCCLDGNCCHGVEYCCDTCAGSCRCSVNGKCYDKDSIVPALRASTKR